MVHSVALDHPMNSFDILSVSGPTEVG